ncbi:MAG: acyl-CoA dehydrogenase family protein [Ilumatobacteraceae bacterium]
MDFDLSDDLRRLQERAHDVALDGVARFGRTNDSWINGFSTEFAETLSAEGWIGMGWPVEHGGGGRSPLERVIVAEQMIASGAPIASMWVADRQMGPSIIAHGTADQKAQYLPDILAGKSVWCIGMSEPDAGSDLANLSTSAERRGDRWVVNGQKIWTSAAARSDFCYLICRTSSEGPPHAGISEIIVAMDTPGIEVRTIRDLVGNEHFCEVFFTDVEVPIENLVGIEGDAFRQTMSQLEHERGGIDRLVSNRPLFDVALERADHRDPLVRDAIARLETGYRIGRMLVYREVLRQAPTGFSAATKCFCTEHEQRVAAFAATVLGADATLWSSAPDDVCRHVAYAPGYTIMGGTSNVMRTILGERVLGLPREPRR